ncbi:hypothetical protein AVEN_64831-1 [Araneus ventricosus]|uniref:Chitin-binding type-2 domain-containing protein n=1 Tax=Araneus ventricosus TaxID=182803 RepID=A0A4Y2GN37_ARAVE|nr:hypothetical protein AVEN_64831-1 [Araneus ventricosus]
MKKLSAKSCVTKRGTIIWPVKILDEFSRRVQNWKWSDYYDRLSGYTYHSSEFKTAKKRVSLEPGTIINPKKFKRESACTSGVKTVPIADNWDMFYNCDDGYRYRCPHGDYFGGSDCKKSIENAHTFNKYPMFRFKPFSVDDWILPFNYGVPKQQVSCSAPEIEFNSVYNICSHPDCTRFPFLSQMKNFSINLKNERSECAFDSVNRRIVKQDIPHRCLFWSQRLIPEAVSYMNACTKGDTVESGHLMLDATLYMTCEEAQMFVFCPSALRKGIVQIRSFFACVPSSEAIVDATGTIEFEHNEIAEIHSANSDLTPDPTLVQINQETEQTIPVGKVIDVK